MHILHFHPFIDIKIKHSEKKTGDLKDRVNKRLADVFLLITLTFSF